ncbi:hypothetical protein NEF87_000975 [Candidatus Lokiarchaeum ossiferum]|uniref:Uncharacterized protein n=1 Tax=Candidatus Lokiarchaeum ossiferum TaxID=2951803 RepID=A0ABY6HMR7_9ARCH|nr:hypothetical protein NEF87_000975 [Candidatus Lokiarchaeum sp. B-35]
MIEEFFYLWEIIKNNSKKYFLSIHQKVKRRDYGLQQRKTHFQRAKFVKRKFNSEFINVFPQG